MGRIEGNWATLLLPLNADESIDYPLLVKEIRYLVSAEVSGIYSNGTAGEFISLSEEEFRVTSVLLASECASAGMPFQIGCSHPSAQISLSRIRFASSLSPSAIQVILPDWFPVTDREALSFLDACCAASEGIPITLYNPPHAKRRLSPETLLMISERVPLGSIKVADGDEAWYRGMQGVMERVPVFVPGHHLATGIMHGAAGSYSNVACLAPKASQAWYRMMREDIVSALALEKDLRRFFETYIDPLIAGEGYANFVIDKFLAVVGGYLPGFANKARFPYDSIDPDRAPYFRMKLEQTAPFFSEAP